MKLQNLRHNLAERAKSFKQIRNFFEARGVLPVDTRLLDQHSVTDPYMSAFQVATPSGVKAGYLQTSPEYAMKRLLASGSGDIYQLDKAFRADESGPHHDGEFTMLEWYRLDFGMQQLMQEVEQLIIQVIGDRRVSCYSYRDAFKTFIGIDPMQISDSELAEISETKLGDLPENMLRDNYLTLLFSELIEPAFDPDELTVIYHYPASQASLAKVILSDGELVGERFEVYCGGLELANGFHELTDAKEQRQRFEEDNKIRKQLGYPQIAIDNRLLEALEQGLPDCSGVALGVDRLLMIKLGKSSIDEVIV